jgi:hypothetical protein
LYIVSVAWSECAENCGECEDNRKKLDFGLDHARLAGRERWFFRVMLAAMRQHPNACE